MEKDLNNNSNNFKLSAFNSINQVKSATKERDEFIKGLDEKVTYWSTMKAAKRRQKNLSFNEYQKKIKEEQNSNLSTNTFGNITNHARTITLGEESLIRDNLSTIDLMSPNFLADFFNKFTTNLGKEN